MEINLLPVDCTVAILNLVCQGFKRCNKGREREAQLCKGHFQISLSTSSVYEKDRRVWCVCVCVRLHVGLNSLIKSSLHHFEYKIMKPATQVISSRPLENDS